MKERREGEERKGLKGRGEFCRRECFVWRGKVREEIEGGRLKERRKVGCLSLP